MQLGKIPRVVGNHLGIDASLTSTGIAVLMPDEVKTWRLRGGTRRGAARLSWFDEQFRRLLMDYAPKSVTVEGYAHAKQYQTHQTGELGGVLRLRLWLSAIPTFIVSPGQLKKFATGTGNSPKPGVAIGLYKRWGIERAHDDEVDAAVAALMGLSRVHYQGNSDVLTKFQSEIVDVMSSIR